MIDFMVVDLPAPLRPSSTTHLARTHLEADIGQDVRAPVVGVEAFDLQHQCAPNVEPVPR